MRNYSKKKLPANLSIVVEEDENDKLDKLDIDPFTVPPAPLRQRIYSENDSQTTVGNSSQPTSPRHEVSKLTSSLALHTMSPMPSPKVSPNQAEATKMRSAEFALTRSYSGGFESGNSSRAGSTDAWTDGKDSIEYTPASAEDKPDGKDGLKSAFNDILQPSTYVNQPQSNSLPPPPISLPMPIPSYGLKANIGVSSSAAAAAATGVDVMLTTLTYIPGTKLVLLR